MKKTKLLSYLFLLLTILVFYEHYFNFLIGAISKYFIILLSLLLIAVHKKIRLRAFILFFSLFFIFKYVSVFWTNSFQASHIVSAHFLTQLLMVFFIIVISFYSYDKKIVDNAMKFNFYTSISIGLLTLFFSSAYQNAYEARQTLTIFNIQMDPNDLSFLCSISVIYSYYYMLFDKKVNMFNLAGFIIGLIALGMTASRGGLVGITVTIIGITLFYLIYKRKISSLITVAVFGFIGYISLKLFLPEASFERLFLVDYSSGSGRLEYWTVGIEMFLKRPIFGYGWGELDLSLHNTYLNILIDNGIFGFLLFSLLIVYLIKKLYDKKQFLPIFLLVSVLITGFFIEIITRRYLWNIYILGLLNVFMSNQKKSEKMETLEI